MADLIDRERLLNSRVYSTRSGKPNYEKMLKNLVNDILTAPTVDTERHAHWIKQNNLIVKCSNCNYLEIIGKTGRFCKHCGCKMDKH